MIDLNKEHLLSLREAASHHLFCRNGKACNFSTIYRHVTRGIIGVNGKRVRLESVKLTHGAYTSREAIQRFFVALNELEEKISKPNSALTDSALKELRDFGI